ncbi:MAG: hypothetical protein ACI4IA_01940 [Acutalibacteraceae bacterium]
MTRDADAGNRHIAVRGHEMVHENLGDAHEDGTESGGDADGKRRGGDRLMNGEMANADLQRGFAADVIEEITERAENLADESEQGGQRVLNDGCPYGRIWLYSSNVLECFIGFTSN